MRIQGWWGTKERLGDRKQWGQWTRGGVGGEYGRVAGLDEIELEDEEVKEEQGEEAVAVCNEEEYVFGRVVGEGEIDECERKEEVSGEGEDTLKKIVKQKEH